MNRGDVVVGNPEPLGRSAFEILAKNVEVRCQLLDERDSLRLFQIDAHALFVECVAKKRRAGTTAVGVGHERHRASPRLAVAWMLDFDHGRAEASQQHRAERQRLHLFDCKDRDAVEWLAERHRAGVRDFSKFHGCIVAGAVVPCVNGGFAIGASLGGMRSGRRLQHGLAQF